MLRPLRPLLTSAPRSGRLATPSVLWRSHRTRCRSPGVSPASFIAHPPDLQFWPLMDMDFATSCPLVRPALPHIRYLFVRSRLCSTLPSDDPSRFRPCASLVLHLHQVAQGTCTPKTPGMPGTHRDRGEPRGSSPPTPPYVRVRIRRFGGLSIHVLHGWQTQTTEASFGEGPVQGFTEADPPRTLGAEDGFARQPFGDA